METRTNGIKNDEDQYLIAEPEIREFMLELAPTALKPIYYLLCLVLDALIACKDDHLNEYSRYLLEELKVAHEFTTYRGLVAIIAGAAREGKLETAIRTVSYAVKLVPVIPSDEEIEALIGQVRYHASERRAIARVAERRKSSGSPLTDAERL